MTDTDQYIQRLLEGEPIRNPVLRSAIQALHLPPGSHGLDVGCGIGLQAMLLAEIVGSAGHVTGVDINPELLAFGEDLVRMAGHTERITFQEGDMCRLPFADHTFDWVWSADCIGYPLGDFASQLKELIRVIRPGGQIAILAWTSQQVLPGYSLLEANLNANHSTYLPFLLGKDPELHFLRALRWLQEAGLEDVNAQTFVGDIQAPLNADVRTALISLFEMLWGDTEPKDESAGYWNEYQRLCKPGSPDFILDKPGYYGFFTYSMFQGKTAT